MKQFSAEQIQERFEQLPKDLQEAITSPEINSVLQAIGEKYSLHIDQLGQLVDLVGLVMLGLNSSSDFVDNLSKEIHVGNKVATEIADDINKELFTKIRASMQALEESSPKNEVLVEENSQKNSISALEQAGDFSIEHEKTETDDKKESLKTMADENIEEKRGILEHIENPVPAKETSVAKEYEQHTEPLVDHLLANSTRIPEEKTVQKAPEPAQKPVSATKPPPPLHAGPDPYREPLEP